MPIEIEIKFSLELPIVPVRKSLELISAEAQLGPWVSIA